MHFLLTNDDGIGAPGLKALGEAILERGHALTVCAPQTQQSATSHHLTLSSPLMVRDVEWEGAKAYAVAGTPVDCARLGPLLSDAPIDFVFSGINNGENAGTAVYYSGTVSAARVARMCNLPAMAVSICAGADHEMRLALGRMAVRLAERLEGVALPRLCLLNLNAPALPPEQWKPLVFAPLSDAFFLDSYEKRVNPFGTTYFWLEGGLKLEPHRPGTDMALLEEGYVTLSLLGGAVDDFDWLCENLPGGGILQD
ncbi:MAG: 5'/3'-nucleotidase SurE [Clostridia bacterium]|nr:5'/3'-nucleotidase SurE [Clostridia bacterium]